MKKTVSAEEVRVTLAQVVSAYADAVGETDKEHGIIAPSGWVATHRTKMINRLNWMAQ